MRRLVPLVIVLVACTGTAEDTTTTAPPAEPSATSTTAPTTPNEPTTTTAVDECVERGETLRDRRGLVCPPHLATLEAPEPSGPGPLYRPGRYETRLFTPRMAFTRVEEFRILGEADLILDLDVGQRPPERIVYPRSWMSAYTGIWATGIASVMDKTWSQGTATDVAYSETAIGGIPGRQVSFVTSCPETCGSPADDILGILIHLLADRQRVVQIRIDDLTGGPVVFEIVADEELFDTYWTEVAQPILDSIEFLDQ